MTSSLKRASADPVWRTIVGGKQVVALTATAEHPLNQEGEQSTNGQPGVAPPKQAISLDSEENAPSDMEGVEAPVGASVTRKRKTPATGKTGKSNSTSKKPNRELADQQKNLDRQAKKGTTLQSSEQSEETLEVTIAEKEESEIRPTSAADNGEKEDERCSSPIGGVQDEVERIERAARSSSISPASGQRGRSEFKVPQGNAEKQKEIAKLKVGAVVRRRSGKSRSRSRSAARCMIRVCEAGSCTCIKVSTDTNKIPDVPAANVTGEGEI
jgi:hypothetical protein